MFLLVPVHWLYTLSGVIPKPVVPVVDVDVNWYPTFLVGKFLDQVEFRSHFSAFYVEGSGFGSHLDHKKITQYCTLYMTVNIGKIYRKIQNITVFTSVTN